MKLVDAMPKTAAGRALGNQLIRSGTSVGANYRAAGRGRSKAEFIAKIGTVVEEADEADELTAIFVASVKTAGQSKVSNQQFKIKNQKSEIKNA
jgi:four helix bundle protein